MNLTWISIFRLGLVQMTLGALVVITTSTLNRLMVVEYALAATIPGLLVAFHYGVQITRPSWGHFSDNGGKRTKWIIGGVMTLCLGTILACVGVVMFSENIFLAYATSILAYALIGLGVGAAGTCLLALLATGTAERRRAAAFLSPQSTLITKACVLVTAHLGQSQLQHSQEDYGFPVTWTN